jgi:hypothetical protein
MVLPASDGIPRVPSYSGATREGTKFRLQGCHLLWRAFPDRFVYPVPLSLPSEWSYNPKRQASWFGLFPFRSPLLRESRLLSSPPGTEMFQFPGCALHTLWIQVWILPHYGQWVPPFGHLRINACLQLPEAFRRLPRPSSAPSAKASTVRPF